jgi:hypothetical protein
MNLGLPQFIVIDRKPEFCCKIQNSACARNGRGPVLGGPLIYVAGTFSKCTSLTQTFLLSRIAHTISLLILVRKVDD